MTDEEIARCRCGLPPVCFGADLVDPQYRCPRCCQRDHAVQHHGPPNYLRDHEAAEGVSAW